MTTQRTQIISRCMADAKLISDGNRNLRYQTNSGILITVSKSPKTHKQRRKTQ